MADLSLLRIDDVAPVEIAAAQALHQDLGRSRIGGEGDLILVAQTLYLVYVVEALGIGRISEEKHKVDLIEGYARADLLRAALIGMQIQRYRQSRCL